jgi:hypothetical protein
MSGAVYMRVQAVRACGQTRPYRQWPDPRALKKSLMDCAMVAEMPSTAIRPAGAARVSRLRRGGAFEVEKAPTCSVPAFDGLDQV